MGVHVDGEVPTPAQFLVEADTEVSGQVLKQAKEAIAGLPALVLKAADNDAAEGDEEGAAEQYMLYLNSTAGEETPERKRGPELPAGNLQFPGVRRERAANMIPTRHPVSDGRYSLCGQSREPFGRQ
jgi:hypothetical protein